MQGVQSPYLHDDERALDAHSMTYSLKRRYGLFSNLTVCLWDMMNIYRGQGRLPNGISLQLYEYDHSRDFYPDLFKPNDPKIGLEGISDEEIASFHKNCFPTSLGLGMNRAHIVFNITNRLIKKYFNFSDQCEITLQKIIIGNHIDCDQSVFIWARKTDKAKEVSLPEISQYTQLIQELKLRDHDVLLQTDDINVLQEFKQSGLKFRTLDEIPYDTDQKGFHVGLCALDDDRFRECHNMTKVTYLQKILCLAKLSSMCRYSITYPGNLSTFIPMLKGSFDNVISFKNDKEYF
jgi:hypothetical protein